METVAGRSDVALAESPGKSVSTCNRPWVTGNARTVERSTMKSRTRMNVASCKHYPPNKRVLDDCLACFVFEGEGERRSEGWTEQRGCTFLRLYVVGL